MEHENKRFILVADRAYFSIDKSDRYAKTNQDFVIRLKDNIQLNRKKSLKRTHSEGSNIVADFTCTLGTTQKQTKKSHRVVEFTDYEGAIVHVVTNLRDVTAEEIAGMYKERWAIESFFRWIKQNINVPVLFGTTKNAVFSHLLGGTLPIEWPIGLKEILAFFHGRYQINTGLFWIINTRDIKSIIYISSL